MGTAHTDWHIRTEGVSKRYPKASRNALDGLTLSIFRGTVFGILGPNGAGKTTTLSILSGLLEPDEGAVHFNGLRRSMARRKMGLVPQELALYPKLTARENLFFFGKLYGVRGQSLAKQCDYLLDLVSLQDRLGERVERFSSGMKRRLNLAAGLVHSPEILLLDEPTVGIDVQSRNRIFELVGELAAEGRTVLYTTHYMEEASRLCDRVAIMDHGTVLVEDTPRAIVEQHSSYRVDFRVDAYPRALAAEVEALPSVTNASEASGLLSLNVPNDEAAMAVLREMESLAERHEVSLSLRRVEEPSLETVFLTLTGRSMRDEVE